MSENGFIPGTGVEWESKGEIWLNGRLNEQQERLERLEQQVMSPNPLAGFDQAESDELIALKNGYDVLRDKYDRAMVENASVLQRERAAQERSNYLETRARFLENHIRQVNRITARITGTEQAMEENTLAAVEESRGFAQRAAP